MASESETLILKLNASGDVIRTTPLLRRIGGHVAWLTAPANIELLTGVREHVSCLPWGQRQKVLDKAYDLVINLEDDPEVATFSTEVRCKRRFGAFMDDKGEVRYTPDSHAWFDLGLISIHGREMADRLKLLNRRTYQEAIFEGLGYRFQGEEYLVPEARNDVLRGDVAIAPLSGPVWPMKNWAYYPELQRKLEHSGLKVNVLPTRKSLLEHIADIRNHRCLVSGDSLPMHIALGSRVPCVTIFTCTSPWEIHDYGLQTKIVSPLLSEFFYQRRFNARATTAVSVEEVYESVMLSLAAKGHAVPPT